jgi:hypothetical protein
MTSQEGPAEKAGKWSREITKAHSSSNGCAGGELRLTPAGCLCHNGGRSACPAPSCSGRGTSRCKQDSGQGEVAFGNTLWLLGV